MSKSYSACACAYAIPAATHGLPIAATAPARFDSGFPVGCRCALGEDVNVVDIGPYLYSAVWRGSHSPAVISWSSPARPVRSPHRRVAPRTSAGESPAPVGRRMSGEDECGGRHPRRLRRCERARWNLCVVAEPLTITRMR